MVADATGDSLRPAGTDPRRGRAFRTPPSRPQYAADNTAPAKRTPSPQIGPAAPAKRTPSPQIGPAAPAKRTPSPQIGPAVRHHRFPHVWRRTCAALGWFTRAPGIG